MDQLRRRGNVSCIIEMRNMSTIFFFSWRGILEVEWRTLGKKEVKPGDITPSMFVWEYLNNLVYIVYWEFLLEEDKTEKQK